MSKANYKLWNDVPWLHTGKMSYKGNTYQTLYEISTAEPYFISGKSAGTYTGRLKVSKTINEVFTKMEETKEIEFSEQYKKFRKIVDALPKTATPKYPVDTPCVAYNRLVNGNVQLELGKISRHVYEASPAIDDNGEVVEGAIRGKFKSYIVQFDDGAELEIEPWNVEAKIALANLFKFVGVVVLP